LVIGQVATLHEIEVHWSLDDLLDANEAMDIQMLADVEASQRARK
jgi:hypothetical protein